VNRRRRSSDFTLGYQVGSKIMIYEKYYFRIDLFGLGLQKYYS